jgi:hypothetical protein
VPLTPPAVAAQAVTVALASAAHFGTGFTDAAIPELVIAADSLTSAGPPAPAGPPVSR